MVCGACGAWMPENTFYCGECGWKRPQAQSNWTGPLLHKVMLPLKGGERRIFFCEEIFYMERIQRETWIHNERETFVTGMGLNDLERLLPSGIFERTHSSYLVRLSAVRSVNRRETVLLNGTIVPLSNGRKQKFLNSLCKAGGYASFETEEVLRDGGLFGTSSCPFLPHPDGHIEG